MGMGIGILIALLMPISSGDNNYGVIAIALFFGAAIGYVIAGRVLMTQMPEMVSLFNGLGGACALFISIA